MVATDNDLKLQKNPAGLLILILCGAAFVARAVGASSELWLDEIHSAQRAWSSADPWTVLWGEKSDNNHPLNTLWLMLLGPSREPFFYRLPAIFLSVLGLGLLARSLPVTQGIFFCVLGAASFVFTLYGSEARGYGLLLFFSSAALVITATLHRKITVGLVSLLALVTCLGLLSHFSFAQLNIALFLWSLTHFARERNFGSALLRAASLHAGPLLICALLYLAYIRFLPPGTGTLRGTLEPVLSTLSSTATGFPLTASHPLFGLLVLLAGLALAVLVATESIRLLKERNPDGMLFLSGIFLIPAAGILVVEPRVLYERYFLLPSFLAYIAFASFLSRLFFKSKMGRIVSLLLLTGFCGANLTATSLLMRYGRGQYEQALSDIASQAPQGPIHVSGDHQYRNETVINYYRRSLPEGERISYESEVTPATRFYFVHSQDWAEAPQESALPGFSLFHEYRSAPLSGWNWFVYRRNE